MIKFVDSFFVENNLTIEHRDELVVLINLCFSFDLGKIVKLRVNFGIVAIVFHYN